MWCKNIALSLKEAILNLYFIYDNIDEVFLDGTSLSGALGVAVHSELERQMKETKSPIRILLAESLFQSLYPQGNSEADVAYAAAQLIVQEKWRYEKSLIDYAETLGEDLGSLEKKNCCFIY